MTLDLKPKGRKEEKRTTTERTQIFFSILDEERRVKRSHFIRIIFKICTNFLLLFFHVNACMCECMTFFLFTIFSFVVVVRGVKET